MYSRSIKPLTAIFLATAIASMLLAMPASARRVQPTMPLTAPGPPADRGRFEITFFRFFVGRQSLENAVEFAGAGDEVAFSRHVLLYNRRMGSQRIFSAVDFTPTQGEMPPNPVRAGHASPRGGLKTGDDVIIPHMPLFSGELIRGENAVMILLSVWEMDGLAGLQNSYANALEAFTPDMETVVDRVIRSSPPSRETVRDFDWHSGIASGGIPAIGVFLGDGPLGLGDPKDRPIGMIRQGNRYSFRPKLLILNFDTAMEAASSNQGLIKIPYIDDPRLGGEYTLFVKVRQL